MLAFDPGISISSPGRICLFGEHQDYLRLPVVACAISLRVTIDAQGRADRRIRIELPDIGTHKVFSIDGTLPYVERRDYFRSAVNVLRRAGFEFRGGLDCTVRGEIPINAGTSSSSALVVTWIAILAQWSTGSMLPPEECARLAHRSEVVEFGEPGGMMDHYAAACGGVLAIDFAPRFTVERQEVELGAFVLGDSREPKDTTNVLARVKGGVARALESLKKRDPRFSLAAAHEDTISRSGGDLSSDQRELLLGTLRNRDITVEGRALLKKKKLDRAHLGELLSEHQAVLRDVLRISTPKLDRMLDAAQDAGAYGGKVNGSGGGGCMFAYAPHCAPAVAEAVERAGGKAYIVQPDAGTRIEPERTLPR